MDAAHRVLEEFEHTASVIAELGYDDRSWAPWRRRVIDQIERGHRTLARIGGTHGEAAAIRWDVSDTTPMLARAFATLHRHLAALVTSTFEGQPVSSDAGTEAA